MLGAGSEDDDQLSKALLIFVARSEYVNGLKITSTPGSSRP